MNYQTDPEGNLYDEKWNFLAYKGEYSFDPNWNAISAPQNQTPEPDPNLQVNQWSNNSQNQKINNPEANTNISTLQKDNKSIFQKISDTIKSLFSWKHVQEEEISQQLWVTLKWDSSQLKYEDKFPSELNFSEDIKRFTFNLKNFWKKFFSDSDNKNNVPRWKLVLVMQRDMVWFLDQLSTLISAWIRLIDSIRIIKNQSDSFFLKLLYISIEEKLNNWKHLSECLEDYPYIFPVKWVKLILAAEASWQMDVVLRDLAKEELKQMQFNSKVKWAMFKPMLLVVGAIALLIFMMMEVVPVLEKAFAWKQEFPPLTKFVIKISHFVQEHFLLVILVPIWFLFLLTFLNSQFISVEKFFNYIKLRLPVFWAMMRRKNIVIFAQNFWLLLTSWVLVSESLKIVAQIMPSVLFRREVHGIRRWVENWVVMSKMMWLTDLWNWNLSKNFYFPLEVAQMMKIWEETGNTVDILKKIVDINNEKIDNTLKNLSSMLEPMMTVIIWILVWTLLMAFMVPMLWSFKAVW